MNGVGNGVRWRVGGESRMEGGGLGVKASDGGSRVEDGCRADNGGRGGWGGSGGGGRGRGALIRRWIGPGRAGRRAGRWRARARGRGGWGRTGKTPSAAQPGARVGRYREGRASMEAGWPMRRPRRRRRKSGGRAEGKGGGTRGRWPGGQPGYCTPPFKEGHTLVVRPTKDFPAASGYHRGEAAES